MDAPALLRLLGVVAAPVAVLRGLVAVLAVVRVVVTVVRVLVNVIVVVLTAPDHDVLELLAGVRAGLRANLGPAAAVALVVIVPLAEEHGVARGLVDVLALADALASFRAGILVAIVAEPALEEVRRGLVHARLDRLAGASAEGMRPGRDGGGARGQRAGGGGERGDASRDDARADDRLAHPAALSGRLGRQQRRRLALMDRVHRVGWLYALARADGRRVRGCCSDSRPWGSAGRSTLRRIAESATT